MPSPRPDLPPLAQYRSIADYVPKYGDFVVWSGWFNTWVGVVVGFSDETNELSIIFHSMPYLLFTMEEDEMAKHTKNVKLTKIKRSLHGTFAIYNHDITRNIGVWFV